MTHRPAPYTPPPVKYVRRTKGKYEFGIVLLGETRDKDKYVKHGIVGTYEEAANASEFEPAVKHSNTGAAYYDLENVRCRDYGNRSQAV